MGSSCEYFPKVCQSCAAKKSLIPTLPANAEAPILKEGWRSCAWQLARQCPGSEFSRALAEDSSGRTVSLPLAHSCSDPSPLAAFSRKISPDRI